MKCPRCQYENRPQAKFCEECATPLSRVCSNCSAPLSPTAKFCPECAYPVAAGGAQPRFASPDSYTPKHLAEKILTSKSALEGERKQVTVLFADLKGSMELLADRDPEEARKILDPVLEHMMEAVHRYEGTVNQVMGDGIMALFGAPLKLLTLATWEALDPPQRRRRTLEAVKRVLLRESQVQPVLVFFEDLHWIDSETQALLDGLIESLPTARLLLVVSYRPEYQHAWGSKTYYTQLRLDALPPESASELLSALLGDDPRLEPLKRLLVKRGNPFFIEESIRTLVETGAL